MMPYPVTFAVEYAESRSRLSVFFRLLLLIPIGIWLYVYRIVAGLAIIAAWVTIVITGRYPEGLYAFVAGFLRVSAQAGAYGTLLTDRYPPFGPAYDETYPVRITFAGPLPHYSRLKTFFRAILAIPIYLFRYAASVVVQIMAFVAWFAIVVLGRLPRGLFDVLALINGFVTRSDAYLFLLTETYPPFQVADLSDTGHAI